MKKIYQYGLLLVALCFLGYHSVYIEKLSTVRARANTQFDFEKFADSLYFQGMLKKDVSIDLSELQGAIQRDAAGTFEKYGNRLGIGNSAFFMVKCRGTVSAITDDAFLLQTPNAGEVSINTQYIFGNALRDASGLVKLTDFKTNAEFNLVSEALNALIRKKVIPPVKDRIKAGDEIEVVGAIKLNKKYLEKSPLIITPAQIIFR